MKTTKRKKPERKIRLLALTANGGMFQVTEGKKVDLYFFQPLASDFGKAFAVDKLAPDFDAPPLEKYQTCLNGEDSVCCCKGFLHWGHCRHIEGLTALQEAGKLS